MGDAAPFLTIEDVFLYLHGGGRLGPIDWEMRSDQHWAVIGPNGSGKSRLMQAIAGRSPVAGGTIRYHFVRNGGSPHDCVAYVSFESQSAALPWESPFHQARWNRGVDQRSLSVSDALSERRVMHFNPFLVADERPEPTGFEAHRARVIDLVGIESLLSRSIDQVSNGERRKVLLAGALLRRPQLLILDNPFAGLDAGFRDRLYRILESLMEGDLRIILVTNGRELLPAGITHLLRIDHGGVIAQEPRERALQVAPEHLMRDRGQAEAFPAAAAQERKDVEAPPTGNLVDMRSVSVSYGGVQVLEKVDWVIHPGENWALLGPNGAGKSTLLSLILGDNPQAYANDVSLFGKRRGSGDNIWDIKSRIGWVAPELHLYYPRNVSCFEVVCSGFYDAMGPYRRCTAQQRDTIAEWLQRLGLAHVGDTSFGALSEGEQRMILIARALVKEPELLVLDEPCQGLDEANRDRVLRTVEALGDHTASSLIYVSHQRDALPGTITHLLRLEGGRVAGRGKVRGVRSHADARARAQNMAGLAGEEVVS
ncbi:MAG: ATP-binding cassette domain-containing protein [Anaerolineae bacterium]|jgi:molybdate transport system ATP-binding protein